MLSDFRKYKLTRLFNIRDFDKDGFLERSDYTIVALRLADVFRIELTSPDYLAIQAGFLGAWERICAILELDVNHAKVPLEQYLHVQTIYLPKRDAWRRDVQNLVRRVLVRADRDRDGLLTVAEFSGFACAFGLSVDDAINMAQQLDHDQDGFLRNADLLEYVEQYYYSDNPDDLGNYFIGLH